MPLSKSVQRVKNRLPIEEITEVKPMQRSRTKATISRKGNDSKEPPVDMPLDSAGSEEHINDPMEETMQKLHIDIEAEIQKRETFLDQEIEELKKKYK
jgi:hypothetical protein